MAIRFAVGDRVKIKETVSKNGKYGRVLGVCGTVTQLCYGLYNVKLDDNKGMLLDVSDQVSVIDEKLKFLEETGQDEFNQNEFNAYQALTLIENGELSKAEKAKLIAGLLKS